MTVINTNVKALYTQAAMQKSAREMTAAMQQLSTGKRINSGKDDAAGLAISARMTQQIRSLNMAVRNAGDAITLIQTAEGATGEMTDMIQRMRELAIQAINDTNNGEQRGYLDLEFQQLKQELVRISETTEWNGFSVLDGSAGYAVGERPVYKTTSVGTFGSVFVDPTTVRTFSGDNAGETQSIKFVPPTATGSFSISVAGADDVDITVTQADVGSGTADTVALKVINALNAVATRNYTAALDVNDPEKVNIYFDHDEEDPDLSTLTGDAAVFGGVQTVNVDFERLDTPTELFGESGGKFLQSGTLSVVFDRGDGGLVATATFTNNAGVELSLDADYDESAGTLIFPQDSSGYSNSAVLSAALTYQMSDGDADVTGTDTTPTTIYRDYTFEVAVSGSVPELETGDVIINGVTINETLTGDDTLSPANNALGSSIAKAAAINRHSAETGVYAVVNENIMGGTAQSGTSVVSGRVVVNGVTSPTITTVMNNQSESRKAVVAAINLITEQTGVRAYDTGTADEGIRLVAADGRNIELSFDTGYPTADFSARTGLRQGVQAGSYSLETSVEGAMVITTDEDGLITNSGLKIGDFTDNVSAVSSNARAAVASGGTPVSLESGDLVINGVAIRGARSVDDTLTQSEALTTTSNTKVSSAIAMAAAINASSAQTGVTAVPNPAQIEGDTTTLSTIAGMKSLYVNGVEVSVDFTAGSTGDTETRLDRVVEALAASLGEHGVTATKNTMGGLTLSTADGRNLSVWVPTGLTAAEFGLTYDGDEATGVTLSDDSVTLANATTVFGGVTLKSNAPITIEPGASGYGSDSNFRALGFLEGTFGGVVDESESKMTPPRTGRLTFHVGPSAGQTITIDLADFGKGGPITSAITGDVDLGDSEARINRIDSVESAQSMLAKLDSSIDKVNATRARMGAVMNRLEHVIDNLMNVSMNTEASRSQIEDADYAAASTQLARTQIMQQASTAVLAQANASQQGVLKLLQ